MKIILLSLWSALSIFSSAAPLPKPGVRAVARGLKRPVSVKFGLDNAAYVVEQEGRILRVSEGEKEKTVFLDISDKVTKFWAYSEQGLLDMALHPGFVSNRRFFAHYTDREGDTVLSEFKAGKKSAVPGSERVLLRQKQPYSNHNGGQIEFGPDGFLYMALGDGGSAGDPKGNGQTTKILLGKILRIDVSTTGVYGIPPANPFADGKKGRKEIWAWGLRNAWRFSFDGSLLFIADVGQHEWEEISVEDTAKGGGNNYGWNVLEGNKCFKISACDKKGMVLPVHVYRNGGGDCSITGGYVYRGKNLPQLSGLYFYSDFCSGALRSFRYVEGAAIQHREWKELNPSRSRWGRVSSLGRDNKGEIYLLDYDRGALLKIIPVQ